MKLPLYLLSVVTILPFLDHVTQKALQKALQAQAMQLDERQAGKAAVIGTSTL